MSVKINSKLAVYLRVQQQNLANAGRAMGNRILSDSRMLAPVLTGAPKSDGRVGALKRDGRVETSQNGSVVQIKVVYGDSRVPYARRRHYENRKNPQTKYYLENAAKNVITKGGIKQFL